MGENNISSVNISQNLALKRFGIESNKLTSIDVSGNPLLERLWVHSNMLEELDVSHNPELEHLVADNNQITSIDISNNTKLSSLGVQYNLLKELDISNNSKLTVLNAWHNNFSSVNVANGNNANMTIMKVHQNPDLTCVQHDAGFDPNTIPCEGGVGWCKDSLARWSEDCTVDITEVALSDNLELYPNPTQDIINIKLENANFNNAVIYNSEGTEVMSSERETFSVQTLEAGIYFIKVYTIDGYTMYKKFIKE